MSKKIDELTIDLGGHFGVTSPVRLRDLAKVTNAGGVSLAYKLNHIALADKVVEESGLNIEYAPKSIGECKACGETVLVAPCFKSSWETPGSGYCAGYCPAVHKR